MHGTVPMYIQNLIGVKNRSVYSLRSNNELLLEQRTAINNEIYVTGSAFTAIA